MRALLNKWNPRVWLRDWLAAPSRYEREEAARIRESWGPRTVKAEAMARKMIESNLDGMFKPEAAPPELTPPTDGPTVEVMRSAKVFPSAATDAGIQWSLTEEQVRDVHEWWRSVVSSESADAPPCSALRPQEDLPPVPAPSAVSARGTQA